jgi:hypothetical protein
MTERPKCAPACTSQGVRPCRTNRPDPSPLPPIARRRCPSCGLHLFLSHVEPADRVGYEERIYECPICAYGEEVTVKFR